MSRGGLQIVPAGMEATWRHQERSDHLDLWLTPDLIQQVAADLNLHRVEILNYCSVHDPRIEHIHLALLAELAAEESSGRFYVEGLAMALASHLIHTYSSIPHPLPEITKRLPAPLLRKVVSVIEDRLTEDLGVVELASEVGLSPSHFSRLFRQSTGLSPHHYIMQRRLERAQSLLKSTRLSIGEIAAAVGFYDQSHLVRHMRRVMGVTPTYIRKNLS